MDVNMPVMDGAQFIHELARQGLNPMLAIVTGCSRRMANSISLMAKEKGLAVVGAFVKPVSPEQMDRLAAGLLRKRSADPPSAPRPDADHASSLIDRQSLESALRDGSIRAWFQPKKSLSSGNIVGAEALVRWQHRELGLMMPSSFLKALRDYGLDHELLIRMLEDGLKAYRIWRGQAEDVTFELLEDDMAVGAGQYYMGTSRLRLKGFGLSQDDFGKGYSTMYSLISTPFTELKIDRAFVCGAAKDEVRAAALVSSVQLGRQLGLQVTAEGVETMQDLQFVRQIGCDYAQGYLISAALDASAFGRLLADEPNPYFPPCTPPH
jgi:EAL domain-containing protein (putative c-di-GMP-specific phosphodiesterase class I)